MNQRGQVGLDIVQKVFLALLVLAVLAFALIITMASLGDSSVAKTSSGSFTTANETLLNVNDGPTGAVDFSVAGLGDVSCSILHIINASSLTTIPASNFTKTGCSVILTSGPFNNSDWNVSYTHTFNVFTDPQQNITAGTASFFSNATTWLTLLSVVVIILIISIVLLAVRGFTGDRKGGL